jgi:putative hydrolase of the HAD superfamily
VVTRGVVFDIDDTLYLERDYIHSGFVHVAQLIATSTEESRDIAAWLWRAFENGVRGDTFNRLVAVRPELAGRVTPAELVDAYRGHAPSIALLPGIAELLDRLQARGLKLGVLSDGPLASQRAKAAALRLSEWFDPVLLTASRDEGFAKPGTGGFEWIASMWQLPHAELAYVADNPLKDFVGPRQLGWLTIRLRIPDQLRFAHESVDDSDRPDVEVTGPAALVDYLT